MDDEDFIDLIRRSNENTDELLSYAVDMECESEKGIPIYSLRDAHCQHFMKYVQKKALLDSLILGESVGDNYIKMVLDCSPSLSVLLQKFEMVGDEFVPINIYLMVFDGCLLDTIEQDKVLFFHEMGHCINDHLLKDDEREVPLDYQVIEDNERIQEIKIKAITDTFKILKHEMEADLYAFNIENAFFDWDKLASAQRRGLLAKIKAFDKEFTTLFHEKDTINEYNNLKKEINDGSYKHISNLYAYYQLSVRRAALMYYADHDTLDGFRYVEERHYRDV